MAAGLMERDDAMLAVSCAVKVGAPLLERRPVAEGVGALLAVLLG